LNAIEKTALELDLRSHGRLAARWLDSLDDLSRDENEGLWAEEALRRAKEMESGEVKGIPVENVLRDVRSRYR